MKKKNKNILIFIALIVVATAVGTSLFFLSIKDGSNHEKNPTPASQINNPDPGAGDSKEDSHTTKNDHVYVEDKTPPQYEGQQPNDSPEYNNEQFRIPEGG